MFKKGESNIVLCGFMGTGKTSVGKALAKDLNMDFVDLDEVIEKKEDCSINEIFENKGEDYFRTKEKEVVAEYSLQKNIVVSSGGGVVLDPSNITNLKKNGVLINLTATPQTILQRTSKKKSRPLLNTADPLTTINKKLQIRAQAYAQCEYQVATDTKSVDELAKIIENLLKV